MQQPSVTTFLFTDIEGSTRLWERDPVRMHEALARHDALARACVVERNGEVVKTTGDGIHAAFPDPLEALRCAIALQLALADADATGGIALQVRCGLHAGIVARRDNDFFGNAVNRAARIMNAAHGGQILMSQAVAALVADRLPEGVGLDDLGAVRLRDLMHPEQVFQVAHPELRRQFPALSSLAATPNNLPLQATSFIGREREVAEVVGLLGSARLLTLVGGGGLGKTRLSLQVASDMLDEFPDGAWFVELAPVGDPRLVPQAVASALGVQEEAGNPLVEAIVGFARDRHMLLVLDNCEHLLQPCAELVRALLEAAPRLTVLASSRERLNIRGETSYPLAPLAVPISQPAMSPDALSQFASVQLFAERALAARPDFVVDQSNAAAVAEICRGLDGIPLALELAAARVRTMPVQTMVTRLADRFGLLRGGDRTALPRQQTMRALFDWSYELLDPDEQRLFRRLAVFAGGFTLDAAEHGTAGNGIDRHAVIDLLAQLVDKSLVLLDAEGARYGMLETVREYAQQKLDESGECAVSRTRHLDYFLTFAEDARPHLFGHEQGRWLAKFDLERENFVAAHVWCNDVEDGGELGLRLARSIRSYCFNRGLLGLGFGATLEALARPGAQQRNLARCRSLADAGQFATRMGRREQALRFLEESLAIARELGDRSRVAAVLQPLGYTHFGLGNATAAQANLEEALELAHKLENKREIAAAMSALAQLHRWRGALDVALPLCDQAIGLVREIGDRESIGIGLLNRAMVAVDLHDADAARAMLVEALAIVTDIGSSTIGQSLLEAAAGLAILDGQWTDAARFVGAAEAQARQSGVERDPADAAFVARLIAGARTALGVAAFAEAETEGKASDTADALAGVRAALLRSS